jgi:hypothetical protein
VRRRPRSSRWPMFSKFRRLRNWVKNDLRKMGPAGKAVSSVPLLLFRAWQQLSWLRRVTDRSLRRALPQLAAWGLLEIPERDRHSPIVQSRLRSGIAAIYALELERLPELPVASNVTRNGMDSSSEPTQSAKTETLEARLRRVTQSNVLSPMASQALNRLVGQLETTSDEALQLQQ